MEYMEQMELYRNACRISFRTAAALLAAAAALFFLLDIRSILRIRMDRRGAARRSDRRRGPSCPGWRAPDEKKAGRKGTCPPGRQGKAGKAGKARLGSGHAGRGLVRGGYGLKRPGLKSGGWKILTAASLVLPALQALVLMTLTCLAADAPERPVVIDTLPPQISWDVQGGTPAFLFGSAGEEVRYEIHVDDGNGAGADLQEVYYCLTGAGTDEAYVREHMDGLLWKRADPVGGPAGEAADMTMDDAGEETADGPGGETGGGTCAFTLRDCRGKVYVRAADRLGNLAVRYVNSLVTEGEEPWIQAAVLDGEGREILSFTSSREKKSPGEADLGDGYGETFRSALQIEVRAIEQAPESMEGGMPAGCSGVRELSWALVPGGTDPGEAEAAKTGLLKNALPADLEALEGAEDYMEVRARIAPDDLQETVAGHGSGRYDLYLWAEDFCGNGEAPAVLPLFLDMTPPEVIVRMEGGACRDGKFYYRKDNAALVVYARDDRAGEGGAGTGAHVRSLTATLRDESGREITKEGAAQAGTGLPRQGAEEGEAFACRFSARELDEAFGDTEQEITVTAQAVDESGNGTGRISGDSTGAAVIGGGGSASFIRDAVPPAVEILYEPSAMVHIYSEEAPGGAGRTGYTNEDSGVRFSVQDRYADAEDISYAIYRDGEVYDSGTVPTVDPGESGKAFSAREGTDVSWQASAWGRDLAGNPAVVTERFADPDKTENAWDGQPAAASTQAGCADDAFVPAYGFVIDRTAPAITLTYTADAAAFVYDDAAGAAEGRAEDGRTAYTAGDLSVFAQAEDGNLDPRRLFYADPGAAPVPWEGTSAALSPAVEEGACLYRVFGTDKAGNPAVVTEGFSDEAALQTDHLGDPQAPLSRTLAGCGASYAPFYALVIDRTPPAVTEIATTDAGTGAELDPAYYEDDQTFYYNPEKGMETVFTVTEEHFDGNRLFHTVTDAAGAGLQPNAESAMPLDGEATAGSVLAAGRAQSGDLAGSGAGEGFAEAAPAGGTYTVRFLEDGMWPAGSVALRGTDRAGNHVVLSPVLQAEGPQAVSQNAAVQRPVRDLAAGTPGGAFGLPETEVALQYARILDRVPPMAVVTHVVPDNTTGYLYPAAEADGAAGSGAALYSKNAVTTTFLVRDTYGSGKAPGEQTPVLLDGEKLKVEQLFHAAGGSFGAAQATGSGPSSLVLKWDEYPGSADPLRAQVQMKEEGHYAYAVTGTDRAGNPVAVQEEIGISRRRGAVLDRETGGYAGKTKKEAKTRAGEAWRSFFVLVYDCTPPAYRFTITSPADLQENYDPAAGIVYYGKSVPLLRARYAVTEENFDDARILSAAVNLPADSAGTMEALSPPWTAPDLRCTGTRERDGVTTAVFTMDVPVNRRAEGVWRFAIEGCDRAGNRLVRSAQQERSDSSAEPSDRAARTIERGSGQGRFWTERKAVDVTAPTGVLQVRSAKDSADSYYEIEFAAGGNIPVRYDPFRKETHAFVRVGSKDRSPTCVTFGLRSKDGGKDAAYQRSNPLVSGGSAGYRNGNYLEAEVAGEQAFYLENVMLRDRAGNVRANGAGGGVGSGCTLKVSSCVYLDVTAPAVSGVQDAEAPQVKITADGTFTRHEGDGERYIYRPDGAALDLKVSVTDPGGKERSSGLGRVTAKVFVGGKDVTDRVAVSGALQYAYAFAHDGLEEGRDPAGLIYEVPEADGHIRIPVGGFAESNDITVEVTAADNSGNVSVPSRDGGFLQLGIDTTAPQVEVNFTDTVEPENGRYFKAGRVAEVVVIDRNVDSSGIRIETNTAVPASFAEPHANLLSDSGGEDGNGDRWTKTLLYSADGDYTLAVSGTDALGNEISEVRWNGPSPNAFTVDRTPPVIRILLPEAVNERDGTRYFDKETAATVEIVEHNFSEGARTFSENAGRAAAGNSRVRQVYSVEAVSDPDRTGKERMDVKIDVRSRCGDEPVPVPERSDFTMAEGQADTWHAVVRCSRDGDYEVTASFVDLAGNRAVVQGGAGQKSDTTAWSGLFVVDLRDPVIELDPDAFRLDEAGDPLPGLENHIYTEKEFAPRIHIRDTNYDAENSRFEVRAYGTDYGQDTGRSTDCSGLYTQTDDGETGSHDIRFSQFDVKKERDGVYRVKASITDLAKRRSVLDFTFSVNRFGSTYLYADAATEDRMDRYYINDTEAPLWILEITPVELREHAAELFKDSVRRVLTEGEEYTFAPLQSAGTTEGTLQTEWAGREEAGREDGGRLAGAGAASGGTASPGNRNDASANQDAGSAGHGIYVYTIRPSVYTGEGVYDFILSSTDIAGGENSTTLYRDGTTDGDRIVKKKFPISFQVDKTAPANRITGIEESKERYRQDRLELTVYPEDGQTAVREVEVRVYRANESGSQAVEDTEKYLHYRSIGEEEDAEDLRARHVLPIEEVMDGIPVVLDGKNGLRSWQLLEVVTTDLAGNVSTDYRAGDAGRHLQETRRRFLVTTNPLLHYYYNRPLFGGTLIGAAILLLALYLVLKRRRKAVTGAGTLM